MKQSSTMTIRVEPELRATFAQVADEAHQPAAQVLRSLMRDYVDRAQRPAISAAERRKRIAAFEDAQASVALEGFQLDEAEAAHIQRFIDGEIDMKEFVSGEA